MHRRSIGARMLIALYAFLRGQTGGSCKGISKERKHTNHENSKKTYRYRARGPDSLLCGDILRQMEAGTLRRVIFAGTGALMSPTSVQQGQPIAGVCHAVILESRRKERM